MNKPTLTARQVYDNWMETEGERGAGLKARSLTPKVAFYEGYNHGLKAALDMIQEAAVEGYSRSAIFDVVLSHLESTPYGDRLLDRLVRGRKDGNQDQDPKATDTFPTGIDFLPNAGGEGNIS